MKRRTFLKALVGAAGAAVAGAAFTAEAQAYTYETEWFILSDGPPDLYATDVPPLRYRVRHVYAIFHDRPLGGIKVELTGKESP